MSGGSRKATEASASCALPLQLLPVTSRCDRECLLFGHRAHRQFVQALTRIILAEQRHVHSRAELRQPNGLRRREKTNVPAIMICSECDAARALQPGRAYAGKSKGLSPGNGGRNDPSCKDYARVRKGWRRNAQQGLKSGAGCAQARADEEASRRALPIALIAPYPLALAALHHPPRLPCRRPRIR